MSNLNKTKTKLNKNTIISNIFSNVPLCYEISIMMKSIINKQRLTSINNNKNIIIIYRVKFYNLHKLTFKNNFNKYCFFQVFEYF